MAQRVTAVTVGAGDLLVVRFDGVLAGEAADRIRAGFEGTGVEVALESRDAGSALTASSLEEATRLATANPGRVVEVDG